jgi:hypothetical protein
MAFTQEGHQGPSELASTHQSMNGVPASTPLHADAAQNRSKTPHEGICHMLHPLTFPAHHTAMDVPAYCSRLCASLVALRPKGCNKVQYKTVGSSKMSRKQHDNTRAMLSAAATHVRSYHCSADGNTGGIYIPLSTCPSQGQLHRHSVSKVGHTHKHTLTHTS